MVHRDGQADRGRRRQREAGRHAARPRARSHQDDALGAAAGREPHQRHDPEQARLGDLAPARLGRADRRVRARERRRHGRHPQRRTRSTRASPTPSSRKAPTPGMRPARASASSASCANEDWQKVDDILDVWFDSGSTHAFVLEDAKHFPRPRRHQPQARRRPGHRDVSRRLRPASRLVPVVAAGKLRHARRRAVRRGADPRLRARRAAAARCRSRSATSPRRRTSSSSPAPTSCGCGSAPRDYADDLRIGPEILKTTVETYRKLRNTHALDARLARAFPRGRPGRAGEDAGARAADAAPARRARPAGAARPMPTSTTSASSPRSARS